MVVNFLAHPQRDPLGTKLQLVFFGSFEFGSFEFTNIVVGAEIFGSDAQPESRAAPLR